MNRSADANRSPRPIRRFILGIGRFVRNTLAVVGALSILYFACFDLALVTSGSMSPTLQGDGSPGSDWMLSERVSYWFRNPRRWEVTQFVTGDHMVVAKRVAGLPNEEIAIRDHGIVVNGKAIAAPPSLAYLRYYAAGNVSGGRTNSCASGYYLLGDDSIDSYDSRYEGPVHRQAIKSRPWLIVWPPSRIGWVNNG